MDENLLNQRRRQDIFDYIENILQLSAKAWL